MISDKYLQSHLSIGEQSGDGIAVGAADGYGVDSLLIQNDVQVVAVVVEELDLGYVDQVGAVTAGYVSLQVVLDVFCGRTDHRVVHYAVLLIKDLHVIVLGYGIEDIHDSE